LIGLQFYQRSCGLEAAIGRQSPLQYGAVGAAARVPPQVCDGLHRIVERVTAGAWPARGAGFPRAAFRHLQGAIARESELFGAAGAGQPDLHFSGIAAAIERCALRSQRNQDLDPDPHGRHPCTRRRCAANLPFEG